MRFFVGITDRGWFDFLSHLDGLDEVNFWQPSGNQQFRALQPGEPFLFKLHSPDDYIAMEARFECRKRQIDGPEETFWLGTTKTCTGRNKP